MSESSSAPPSLWALTILCLLRKAPMHPYEMQRLIRQRKKDDFLELKRGSLYHNIDRLQRSGFIEQVATSREGRRPERTVYRLTSDGRARVALVAERTTGESGDGSGPVSRRARLPRSSPVRGCRETTEGPNGSPGSESAEHSTPRSSELIPRIGRLVLIEAEYERAMHQAEMAWIRSLIHDIQRGALAWNPEAFFNRPGATS